jgi:large-conductance mechanosensitive channel
MPIWGWVMLGAALGIIVTVLVEWLISALFNR